MLDGTGAAPAYATSMGVRSKRPAFALSVVLGVLLTWLCAPATAGADEPSAPLIGPCRPYESDDGQDDVICSGQVPSFDGSPLDVDLTLPHNRNGRTKHPLIILLHGFSADKHDWESRSDEGDERDKWHWNNHWFAKHGYYVLTYTARGFRTDPPEGNRPDTPSGTSVSGPSGTIQLKSREAEVKDTQYLAALSATAFPDIDIDRLAVSGNSYGAGESWLQASQSRWPFPGDLARQRDSENPPEFLRLQAAVPKYGWTDLAYSLAPNGHPGGPSGNDVNESSMGEADDPNGRGFPVGTLKLSYVNGFYLLGTSDGVFEQGTRSPQVGGDEGPINIPCWKARADGPGPGPPPPPPPDCFPYGDPYSTNGVEDERVREIRRGLTDFRGSYYQTEKWNDQAGSDEQVAIFSQQGWSDDLFPAVESFRQFKDLKRRDPRWPVAVELADIGHPRAQNEPETWRRLNKRAFEWLQSNINPQTRDQATVVASEPTICANDGEPDRNEAAAQRLTGRSPEDLSAGTLRVEYKPDQQQTLASHLPVGDPDAERSDPVFGGTVAGGEAGSCVTSETDEYPGRYSGLSAPLPDQTTYVGTGEIKVPYELVGGNTATLNARVWDKAPDGTTTLMTRGTYRIDVAPGVPGYDQSPKGALRLALFGNHWPLKPGHRIRLDLAQVDAFLPLAAPPVGFLRPSNVTSSIKFDKVELELPTREAGTETLTGG